MTAHQTTAHQTASALVQVRSYLASAAFGPDGRLPSERELSVALGLSRSALRHALVALEAEGLIWRHVGKGTFLGCRQGNALAPMAAVAHRTNPVEVMQARTLIEPEVAALAALNATLADISEMRLCLQRSRAATSWPAYEIWAGRFHRAIGKAAGNGLLATLLDRIEEIRRAVAGAAQRRRGPGMPPPDHRSFAEHEAIMRAVENRAPDEARDCMLRHLEHIGRNLLRTGMPG